MARANSVMGELAGRLSRVPVKIGLAFASVLATILITGLVLFANMQDVARASAATARAHDLFGTAQIARYALARQENSLRGYLISGEAYYLRRIERVHAPLYDQQVRALDARAADDPQIAAIVNQLHDAVAEWRGRVLAPVTGQGFSRTGGASVVVGEGSAADALMTDAEAALDMLVALASANMAREAAASDRAVEVMTTALVIGLLLSGLIATVIGVLLTRDIGRPVTALTAAMRRLADGDTGPEPPGLRRGDEIGEMAQAVETFRRAAIIKTRLEIEAEQSRIAAEALTVAAQAANRAKSEFLATMTHELRTPLNGVLGMAQIMAHGNLDPVQRGQLETINESGRSLLRIINDVLEISKAEAGQLEILPAPIDAAAFVSGLQAMFAPLAAEKGLEFRAEAGDGMRGWFIGDEIRLRQVTGNLVSNALKFTEQGRVEIRLDLVDERLSVAVSDTGIGIAAERQAELFGRFVQLDASATRRHGGAGLGLAICREIITSSGGHLEFTSRPGSGSTFRFEVPAPACEPPAAASEPHGPSLHGRRVLVADDHPANRMIVQTLLSHAGIEAVAVADGAEAVAAWRAETWDAVLMDIHMPVMDGIAATEAIRDLERDAGERRTPIIAVTASTLSHETETYLAAGMDDCVPKPIELERMLAALRGALADPRSPVVSGLAVSD